LSADPINDCGVNNAIDPEVLIFYALQYSQIFEVSLVFIFVIALRLVLVKFILFFVKY
jgi:hypothetical protein